MEILAFYYRSKSHFEDDGTQSYLVLSSVYKYYKKIANSIHISALKCKGKPDESINPNLGVIKDAEDFRPSSWFSLNNSETVKAVTLEFCSPKCHFIRDIHAKFVPVSRHCEKLKGCISNFQISGQSFRIKNCQNSRTGNDIYMKLGPVTKFDKRNRATSKKDVDDVISTN